MAGQGNVATLDRREGRHSVRTIKQDELAEKHGTPEQFKKAIWKAYSDLFISHEEATSAIRQYQTEWNDASTGYAANAHADGIGGSRRTAQRDRHEGAAECDMRQG